MPWIELNSAEQLSQIKELSRSRVQVIFKHSTRCSISQLAKNRLERNEKPATTDCYFLDLIKHRTLSNSIAEDFAVKHESPQVLLIKDMECVYDESQSGIQMADICEQIASF
jgi:bacillithiol system protein YtxJ